MNEYRMLLVRNHNSEINLCNYECYPLRCRSGGSRPGTSGTAAGGGSGASEDFELQGGYAFSQEEGGAVSQKEYIRRYDTTKTQTAGTGSGGSRPKSGDSIGGT